MQKIVRKNLTQKKIWTLKCFKMDPIFKSPYHAHFWMDFNVFSLNMHTCMLKSYLVGLLFT